MASPAPTADTDRLLELLREAGPEAVTLDELRIVGVRDPAAALLALEVSGHGVMRVSEHPSRGRPVTCVRLAGPGERPTPPPAPEPATARASSRDRRPLLLALVAALLVVLVASRR
jgi:hypothetical protein